MKYEILACSNPKLGIHEINKRMHQISSKSGQGFCSNRVETTSMYAQILACSNPKLDIHEIHKNKISSKSWQQFCWNRVETTSMPMLLIFFIYMNFYSA